MIKFRSPENQGPSFVVTFTLPAYVNDGRPMSVVWEINDWDPHALPMARAGDGACTATVDLLPGRYRFGHLSDQGECFNDEAPDDSVDNLYGGVESAIDLAPTTVRHPPLPGQGFLARPSRRR